MSTARRDPRTARDIGFRVFNDRVAWQCHWEIDGEPADDTRLLSGVEIGESAVSALISAEVAARKALARAARARR